MKEMKASHTSPPHEAGFALVVVIWIVALAALIAVALASQVRSEAGVALARGERLRAELLAESGLAFAEYMNLSVGASGAGLTEIPVSVVVPGFHFRVNLPTGRIDLYLEGEDGKISLTSAPRDLLESFFRRWPTTAEGAAELVAAIEDWRDIDSQQQLLGAEDLTYRTFGYGPRNSGFGIADPLLVRGLVREDFRSSAIETPAGNIVFRPGLGAFVTTVRTEGGIDPNLAPSMVLASIPGISAEGVASVVQYRSNRRLAALDDLEGLPGISMPDAGPYLAFAPPSAPAILAIGTTGDGSRASMRTLSRLELGPDPITLAIVNRRVPTGIERDVFPEFAAVNAAFPRE